MAPVRPDADKADRFEDSPISWFGELLLARDRSDFKRAAEAERQLARLGWTFRYRKPHPADDGKGVAS